MQECTTYIIIVKQSQCLSFLHCWKRDCNPSRNPNPQDSVGCHGWKINKFSAVARGGSQWLRVPATCMFEPYTETSWERFDSWFSIQTYFEKNERASRSQPFFTNHACGCWCFHFSTSNRSIGIPPLDLVFCRVPPSPRETPLGHRTTPEGGGCVFLTSLGLSIMESHGVGNFPF